jgi:hypothetical protein
MVNHFGSHDFLLALMMPTEQLAENMAKSMNSSDLGGGRARGVETFGTPDCASA